MTFFDDGQGSAGGEEGNGGGNEGGQGDNQDMNGQGANEGQGDFSHGASN